MADLSYQLAVDVGNTKIKAAVFHNNILQEVSVFERNDISVLSDLLSKHDIIASIISSVAHEAKDEKALLSSKTRLVALTYETDLPFKNLYKTPQTLGMDRVAGVAGAQHFYPDQNCLIIDAGTCITYDLINHKNEYLGGAISPGLHMRLDAMHHFTQRLPKISFRQPEDFIGKNTEESLLSGSFFGLAGEINEAISRYEKQFSPLQVIICGGDAEVFGKHIKNNIFAAPYLVLYGLNKILSFHVEKGL